LFILTEVAVVPADGDILLEANLKESKVVLATVIRIISFLRGPWGVKNPIIATWLLWSFHNKNLKCYDDIIISNVKRVARKPKLDTINFY
jgi:hypothetical protein